MATHNGNAHFDLRHSLDEPFDHLKAGVKKVYERATTKLTGEPTRLSWFVGKAGDMIKLHPFVAVGCGLGVGYLVARIARR